MNLLDDEVFAVITAVIVVASVLAAASMLVRQEGFSAIGLLNKNCRIGDYPGFALVGENLSLCIYIANHEGRTEAYTVVYRFASPSQLPTNQTPSPAPQVWNYTVVLADGQETLLHVKAKIPENPLLVGQKATLIFELWAYDTERGRWVYTGKWAHLHVRVEEAPLP